VLEILEETSDKSKLDAHKSSSRELTHKSSIYLLILMLEIFLTKKMSDMIEVIDLSRLYLLN